VLSFAELHRFTQPGPCRAELANLLEPVTGQTGPAAVDERADLGALDAGTGNMKQAHFIATRQARWDQYQELLKALRQRRGNRKPRRPIFPASTGVCAMTWRWRVLVATASS
jgi:hypothetical protein